MTKTKKDRAAQAMTAERVQQVQNLRRSGAAGGHDSRPRRTRTRAASKRAALREW